MYLIPWSDLFASFPEGLSMLSTEMEKNIWKMFLPQAEHKICKGSLTERTLRYVCTQKYQSLGHWQYELWMCEDYRPLIPLFCLLNFKSPVKACLMRVFFFFLFYFFRKHYNTLRNIKVNGKRYMHTIFMMS